jgi:hypothetical protein
MIRVWVKNGKNDEQLYVNEDELLVFKLSGEYRYIEYLNDKNDYHRLDGPAFESSDGYKAWWVDDKRHRLDGPAVERADGSKEWYIGDKHYTQKQLERKFK